MITSDPPRTSRTAIGTKRDIMAKHDNKPQGASPETPAEALIRRAQAETHESWHIGARLRNYFLTGILVVGPVTITAYILWWFVNQVDAWVKPLLPRIYNPDTYLPIQVPGIGLVFAILGLMLVGALAANLLGRTLFSTGELMLERMPIVRNVYGFLKQVFESVIQSSGTSDRFQKVGLLEFPSKGIWSLVFVTADGPVEIKAKLPGEQDLVTIFMPTGIVPPHGFVCFVPRASVTLLNMSVEDAAKIIVSAGMAGPEQQAKLQQAKLRSLAERQLRAAGKAQAAETAAAAAPTVGGVPVAPAPTRAS
jgi:uncharacterized membrane protein